MLQPRVGLEVHVQLATASKFLCACPLQDGAPPNALVCPICTGHPGTLPTLNDQAVKLAIKAGLALNGQLNRVSSFDRKHYRYPDLPKGYQVTQARTPLVGDATLHVSLDDEVHAFRIQRIHLEEDSGKLLHRDGRTLVDYNRAGIPLIEVVGAPDLENGRQAEAWLRMLHRVLVFAGITKGEMDKGHLRCDANISVGTSEEPGERVEVKNINSFRFVRRAVDSEIERQTALLKARKPVRRETRGWTGTGTVPLRDKEQTRDYLLLPEPDLPPVVLTSEEVERAVTELPGAVDKYLLYQDLERLQQWRHEFGLEREQVQPITEDPQLEELFREAHALGANPLELAHWIVGPVRALMNKHDHPLSGLPLTPEHMADLCRLMATGSITRATARKLLDWVGARDGNVEGLVEVLGWHKIKDLNALRTQVRETMTCHPEELRRLQEGNTGLADFFVGKVIAATQGRADPDQVHSLVREIASA